MRSLPKFDHPSGLVVLFSSALWEMFALFGMRAVLIYYLTQELRFDQAYAVQVYSLSGAAIFLTGLLGGYVADRLWGLHRAAVAGALMMGVGHFILMSPGLLFPGLALIALGNGFYKPTMWAQVGLLYSNADTRRERGYVVFHVGCNLGALVAPFVCGWLGEAYGWKWAFLVSGVGMLVAAAILGFGRRLLVNQRAAVETAAAASDARAASLKGNLALLALAWLAAVLFWTAYSQIGSTFALWVEASVARTIMLGGSAFTIPAAWFQAVNPALVFLLAPLVTWWWSRDRAQPGAGRDLAKMAIGAGILAASFALLAAASAQAGEGGKVNALWVVLALAPYTLAELVLPPVSMGLYTRLSPARLATIFVSILFLSQMAGNVIASFMGGLWVSLTSASYFALTAAIALGGAVVLLATRLALRGGRVASAGDAVFEKS